MGRRTWCIKLDWAFHTVLLSYNGAHDIFYNISHKWLSEILKFLNVHFVFNAKKANCYKVYRNMSFPIAYSNEASQKYTHSNVKISNKILYKLDLNGSLSGSQHIVSPLNNQ